MTLRRRTTTCQKLPHEYLDKIVNYILNLRQLRTTKRYALDSIYACDETAVFYDNPRPTTVDNIGSKEVSVRSTGHEKSRVTVMLCAKANGEKCKPLILLERKRPLQSLEKFRPHLAVVYGTSGWMDDNVCKDFLKNVVGAFSFGPRLLIWDSFRAHTSTSTKAELRKLKIDSAVVPGGCTKYLQAADVSWNAPFKVKMRELHDQWLSNGPMAYTKAGNIKAPDIEIVCEWVVKAWHGISSEIIVHSFRSCGISIALDGSEDGEITCFRKYPEMSGGLDVLRDRMRTFDGRVIDIENGGKHAC